MVTLEAHTSSYLTIRGENYIDALNQIPSGFRGANIADIAVGRLQGEQIFYPRVATTDLVLYNPRKDLRILLGIPDFRKDPAIVDENALVGLEQIIIAKDYLNRLSKGFSTPEGVMQDEVLRKLLRSDNEAYKGVRGILGNYVQLIFSLEGKGKRMAVKLQPQKKTSGTYTFIEVVAPSISEDEYLALPLIFESMPKSNIVVKNGDPRYSRYPPLIAIRK